MNEVAIFGDRYWRLQGFLRRTGRPPSVRQETMNNALTAIIIAVGGTSLIFMLVSRLQDRRNNLGRSYDSAGSDGGSCGGESGSLLAGPAPTITRLTMPHLAAHMAPAVRLRGGEAATAVAAAVAISRPRRSTSAGIATYLFPNLFPNLFRFIPV
jgi:hypothetical protein